MKLRTVSLGVLLSLLIAGAYALCSQGAKAPAVEFTTIDGERIALRELGGSPVLVNFWSSDCRSCLAEMPALSELYQHYAPRGLKVIGVAMAYDMPSEVQAVTERLHLPYPVALDVRGDHAKAFAGVELVPYSLLIAGDGRIVLRKLGLLDMAELRTRIEELLTEV